MTPVSCPGFERFRDLLRDSGRPSDRDRTLLNPLREGGAFDELENERTGFEPVNARDVRMV
jgi:hypothetical protein